MHFGGKGASFGGELMHFSDEPGVGCRESQKFPRQQSGAQSLEQLRVFVQYLDQFFYGVECSHEGIIVDLAQMGNVKSGHGHN